MKCPNCGFDINIGRELGKRGKGKKIKYSQAELKKRTERLLANRYQKSRKEPKT